MTGVRQHIDITRVHANLSVKPTSDGSVKSLLEAWMGTKYRIKTKVAKTPAFCAKTPLNSPALLAYFRLKRLAF